MTPDQVADLAIKAGYVIGAVIVAWQAASAKMKANEQQSRLAMGVDAFRELREGVADLKVRMEVLERRKNG